MNPELLTPFAIVCTGSIIAIVLYDAVRHRQIKHIPISFTMVGIILTLMGSMILEPYTVQSTYRQDQQADLTRSFVLITPHNDLDRPAYENGSLRLLTLESQSAKTYCRESLGLQFPTNTSIIQLSISTSSRLIFGFAELYSNGSVKALFLNQTVGASGNVGGRWIQFFWTPPYSPYYDLGLIFGNPSDNEVVFYTKVTAYYLKGTETEQITKYRTLLDPYFAYAGITLIVAAIAFETWSLRQVTRKEHS
jgi:hypothetical protein